MSQRAPEVTRGASALPVRRRLATAWLRAAAASRYGPAVVLLVAGVTRLVGLAYPPHLVFDETYYVKDAWSLLHLGYEGTWSGDDANRRFESGIVDGYSQQASYIAHPPLGKWLIGLGEALAGGAQQPYGWRLSVAVAGIAAVALLMLVTHRMFRTPFVTTLAGGLLAIDSNAITLSRVGLLDNLVMVTALTGFALVLEDRIRAERRFGAWLMHRRRGSAWGPTLWWRPWLLAAGVAFGLCSAVKWSGLYFLVAFVAYAVGSDLLLRRRIGARMWLPAGLLRQAPVLVVTAVVPAVGAYLASWTGWFLSGSGYDRRFVEADPSQAFTGLLAWVPRPLQDLWAWHSSIYAFHTGLTTRHQYESPAWQWPLLIRPTSMWWDGKAGSCGGGNCVSAIVDLPNPLIWYGGVAAVAYLVVRFVRRREWQAGLILMGLVAGYLPWLAFPNRTIFFFYSIAFEPYLVLALAATIGLLVMRPPEAAAVDELTRSDAGRALALRRGAVAAFLVLTVLLSAFFLPLSTGLPVPYWFWHSHMWLPSWV